MSVPSGGVPTRVEERSFGVRFLTLPRRYIADHVQHLLLEGVVLI